MRSPWTGCLVIVMAACVANARAQYPEGPYGPPPEADCPSVPPFGVVPGPNLACQPVPALQQTQECVPLLDIRRFYFSADYICWWFKNTGRIPPLATVGNENDAPIAALGQPGTTVIFGGSPIDTQEHSGVLVNAGYWLDSELTFGIEGSYFFAGGHNKNFHAASTGDPGTPNIGRPFFNVDFGAEDATLVSLNIAGIPGRSGSLDISYGNRLSGGDLDFMVVPHLWESNCFRMTFLAGARILEFDESLNINSDTTDLPVGSGIHETEAESFATRNSFYGGQLGLNVELTRGPWILNLKGKVAAGDMHEVAKVSGFVTNVDQTTGIVTTGIGGLLTQPSNIGQHQLDHFAVVPEGTLTLAYSLCRGMDVHVSYDFLYLSRVARSDNIDRSVSIQQIPFVAPVGLANRPIYTFNQTGFWAQGVNVGVQLRF